MKHALEPAPTTDLSDANPDRARQVLAQLRDFGGRKMFAGRIRTAVTMEDTKLVQQLFREDGEGAVCVVDGGGSLRSALLGDINADILQRNGWAGIIINGAVRDVGRLAEIDIGVKALGVTPVRSGKIGSGAIDVPVAFGGVLFVPGQCAYCDADGVVISDAPIFSTEGQ